ncbi:hypothetical protein LCGC14_2101320 [marine sediment metagenome]|uniref:Uncharacterized protein n=1 Tax=marine sediment metagenome TaxID=412755 RepID=A0A0F9E9R4_9ZZZZ
MASGTSTVSGGGGSEELIAVDVNRDFVLIQLQSDHPTYFGFGETAVTLQGICLLQAGATVKVRGPKARLAINVIAAGNAIIGWETFEDIEYSPGFTAP